MPQIDSLLRIVVDQGANELRVGSERAPAMYAQGTPKKLTIPATSTATLRDLFGELLSPERLAQLERLGRIDFEHDAGKLGPFRVTLTKRPGSELAFDAILIRGKEGKEGKPGSTSPSATSTAVPGAPSPSAGTLPRLEPSAHAATAPSQTTITPLPAEHSRYRVAPSLIALTQRAFAMGASDLHLSEDDPPMARVHGRLTSLGEPIGDPLRSHLIETFGEEVLSALAARSSLDLSLDLGQGQRARVNLYRSARGLSVAIRLLRGEIPALDSLGFPLPIDDLAHLSSGLVLLTGPTGCGKSTTLAALASVALRDRSIVLLTLEDPIEYRLSAGPSSLVRQRQVGVDVRDFPSGLRDALREDPDVILIGEMRDAESIQLALTAAETGHLVLASLHARSAAAAVERIIDTYPAERQGQIRLMLADSLRAVVAQRLLPSSRGDRVLAAELLRVTTSVAAAIRDGRLGTIRSAMQSGRDTGMIILERVLADMVRARLISLETARSQATDPTMLAQYLGERSGS